MPTRDLDIYYQRWLVLDGQIKSAIKFYGNIPDGFPRQGTIVTLLLKLRDFAAGQFLFFYYGFDPKVEKRPEGEIYLQPWDEYPPEDVLTGILDQIGHDLVLLQNIANQRLNAFHAGDDGFLRALDKADKLAWLALEPAVRRNVIDKPDGVLTYFEKSALSYSIPYAKIALIAVPLTCLMENNHQDYLAIPHETGHYVYRHLNFMAVDELRQTAADFHIDDQYRDWIRAVFEELCADIYSCLIGGPVMALDFERLSLQNSQENFRVGDDAHPNPAVRPFLYCQILGNPNLEELTHVTWRTLPNVLAERWREQLLQRHTDSIVVNMIRVDGQTEVTQHLPRPIATDLILAPGGNAAGRFGALGEATNFVINALLDYVKKRHYPDQSQRPGWADDVTDDTDPDQLFELFERWFKRTLDEASAGAGTWAADEYPYPDEPPVVLAGRENYSRAAWFVALGAHINLDKYRNPDKLVVMPSGEVKDPAKMKRGAGWGYILFAQGWTTEGPSDSHMPPLL